jgi:predicted PolB exonuclease-like 3'-5' exonuclease
MDIPKKLKNILFVDIETVSYAPSYAQMEDRLKPLWDRKASFINPEEESRTLYKRAGIYAEFGKIVTISAGFFFMTSSGLSFKVKSFAGDDERKVLQDFIALTKKYNQKRLLLCAHNGKEFDFPYLCRRMLVNQLDIPEVLAIAGKKPWEVNHIDTLELWKFGDRKHYTSLELLAALFNIPTSKGEFDGSMVNDIYYKEKDLQKISEYCIRDVVVTAQVYLKFQNLAIMPKENIFIIN